MTNLQYSASPVRPDNDHVCLYSSYFTQAKLPYFVRVYLEHLLPHFGRIVLLTNDDRELDHESLEWLRAREIELMPVLNEGYDFGMWQKVIRRYPELTGCRRLCLANDSCLCFAPLDDFMTWASASGTEAAGMVKSWEGAEHLQSYLLVFSGRAIAIATSHISNLAIDIANYDDIVHLGELGLSDALLTAGIPLHARYWDGGKEDGNPSFVHSSTLIEIGMPLLKRKLLINPKRHVIRQAMRSGQGISRRYYLNQLRTRHPGAEAVIARMFAELPQPSLSAKLKTWRQIFKFWLGMKLGGS